MGVSGRQILAAIQLSPLHLRWRNLMLKRDKHNFKRLYKGQATIEFAFSIIIVALMIYGALKIVQWTGTDLIARRQTHDSALTDTSVDVNYSSGNPENGPLKQITPNFHYPTTMNAVFGN